MQDMSHFILSTSTLSSPALQLAGFGPVNADCYGIPYILEKDSFNAGVTSYHKGSSQYADCIKEAAKQIRAVIEYSA